ncbi:patatin-like phospholipase family protein [Flavobacterium sp. 3HN19-14]|uniref:patatin-like phospholipase family protein n=1 Tax=Flavobacterium sp. 3HN19-14 TaxID=3448133 RepID=UPI003EE31812
MAVVHFHGKPARQNQDLFLALFISTFVAAQTERPKIGLTLSGGGAKGIAHIGLLMAIDSVGLKVDYVTGTSMGSVVGGLYAVGYSGKDILKIARRLKWESLLTNDPPLNSLSIKEREHMGEYIELPLKDGKLAFQRGFIESNEMWLALAELYYPYYEITDFNKFDKKFACIATDLSNGEMVVLDKGNIVKAIRASMAIPSIFTPVEINGKMLVDGGVVRNFPVANVKQMGAKIVIGSDVSDDERPVQSLSSPLEVYGRLPFYKAVADLEEQRKLVDIYVDYPLGKFNSASFSSADKLIDIGIEKENSFIRYSKN